MNQIIVTTLTKEELEEMISLAVKRAIAGHKPETREEREIYFDIEEASAFLKLAKQTLYQLSSNRKIPTIKRGKKLYFLKTELTQWLKSGRRKTLTEIQEETRNYLRKARKKR